jgi:hypothetical protein
MSISFIKKAAEKHLLTLTPSIPTSFEGVSFAPPSGMYQRAQFLIRSPDDPVLGTGYYRENISFQVFVSIPDGNGTGDAYRRADLIRNLFKKGTTLFESGISIHVLTTPKVSTDMQAAGRIIVPVFIDLTAEIYSV